MLTLVMWIMVNENYEGLGQEQIQNIKSQFSVPKDNVSLKKYLKMNYLYEYIRYNDKK